MPLFKKIQLKIFNNSSLEEKREKEGRSVSNIGTSSIDRSEDANRLRSRTTRIKWKMPQPKRKFIDLSPETYKNNLNKVFPLIKTNNRRFINNDSISLDLIAKERSHEVNPSAINSKKEPSAQNLNSPRMMPKSMQNLDKRKEEINSLDILSRKFSASSNSNKKNNDYCFDKRKKSENKENSRIGKEEYYLKILKKMELVKFVMKDNKIIIESTLLPLLELSSKISLKLGQECFTILKSIFSLYADPSTLKITHQNLSKFRELFFPDIDSISFDLILKQKLRRNACDFVNFVEILFKLFKIKENNNDFKSFLVQLKEGIRRRKEEEILIGIQVFYGRYPDFKNPALGVLVNSELFLKNVFKVYSKRDIKKSQKSFIDEKGLRSFAYDFQLMPNLLGLSQINLIFKSFAGSSEIVDFSGFIMILCSIAHMNNNGRVERGRGFYYKINTLIQTLLKTSKIITLKEK